MTADKPKESGPDLGAMEDARDFDYVLPDAVDNEERHSGDE
jgi:hypothetical protein